VRRRIEYPDCGEVSNGYSLYFAMCGDGIFDPNGYTPENCMTCPQDCGPQVHSEADYLADCVDNCPSIPNADLEDADMDCPGSLLQLGAYPRGARGELHGRAASLHLAENIYSLTDYQKPWRRALELFGGVAGPGTVRMRRLH